MFHALFFTLSCFSVASGEMFQKNSLNSRNWKRCSLRDLVTPKCLGINQRSAIGNVTLSAPQMKFLRLHTKKKNWLKMLVSCFPFKTLSLVAEGVSGNHTCFEISCQTLFCCTWRWLSEKFGLYLTVSTVSALVQKVLHNWRRCQPNNFELNINPLTLSQWLKWLKIQILSYNLI